MKGLLTGIIIIATFQTLFAQSDSNISSLLAPEDSLKYMDGNIVFNFPKTWSNTENNQISTFIVGDNINFMIVRAKGYSDMAIAVEGTKNREEKNGAIVTLEDVSFGGAYAKRLTSKRTDSNDAHFINDLYFYQDGNSISIIGYGGLESNASNSEIASCLAVINSAKYIQSKLLVTDKYSFTYPYFFENEKKFPNGLSYVEIKTNCPIISDKIYPITLQIWESKQIELADFDNLIKDDLKYYKKSKYKNIADTSLTIGEMPAKRVQYSSAPDDMTVKVFIRSAKALYIIEYSSRLSMQPAITVIFNKIMETLTFL